MFENPVEILLVEDNPNDVELALHAFRKNKITNRIHIAKDGVEALDFIFRKGGFANRRPEDRPILILLDLKLPLIDGIEVLRQVKADPKTRMIPVVMLTSSREEQDITGCYELGANSYIVKPVDYEKFVETVGILGMYWLVHNQVSTSISD
jgi:two-component system response regulator